MRRKERCIGLEKGLEFVFTETGLANDGFECAARQAACVHWNRGHDFTFGVPQEKMAASLAPFFEARLFQDGDNFSRGKGGKPAHATAGDLT